MICSNCGAQLPEETELCPYCGAANDNIIERKQEDAIKHYNDEANKIVSAPERMVKETRLFLWKAAAAVSLVFIVLLIICSVFFGIQKKIKAQKARMHEVKLEECYEAGDYDKLYDLCYHSDIHSYSYEKYNIVARIYSGMKYYMDCDDIIEDVKVNTDRYYFMSSYIEALINTVAECDKCEEKGYVYEEEKGIVQIRQMASNILISKFMLTEKEIEDASEKIRKEKDVDYEEIARLSAERLKG